MPRAKFQTLTEQMFYILLCLRTERCGIDIMDTVQKLTGGRISVGSGTLYNLLEQFQSENATMPRSAFCAAKPAMLTGSFAEE